MFIAIDAVRRINVDHIVGYYPAGDDGTTVLTAGSTIAGESLVIHNVDLPVAVVDRMIGVAVGLYSYSEQDGE